MSHGDHVSSPPAGFTVLAHTPTCEVAAMGNARKKIYGVQFHPEVVHTPQGARILKNFLFAIAGCTGGWSMKGFIEEAVGTIRCEVKDGKAVVTAEKAGQGLSFEADKVLVAVGRKPNTAGLNLEAAGVTLDARGRVEVDAELRTKAAGIWALGDLVSGPMLAHKAEAEANLLAERIAGHKVPPMNHDLVPGVVYTSPEVAGVGLTEKMARERGMELKVGKSFYAANGLALASDAAEGYAKVISEKGTDRLLGVQIVGAGASELIAEAVAHLEYGGSAEDIALCVHAHPTLSEVLKAAAE
jgi:dihydrolipoamide dehydrogenase